MVSSSSSSSSSSRNCRHWYVRHGLCVACRSKRSVLQARPFNYLSRGLRLSPEAVSFTKRFTTLTSLHAHRKLHLVLDLDQTLIHSVDVSKLSESEKYLIEVEKSGSKNNLKSYEDRLIKLRPFVNEFLREANKLFNMYVYTKSGRSYAQAIVRILDPHRTYFGNRVITKQESPKMKTLDLVLADERGVVIVDDRVNVWPNHKRNLLQVYAYAYFKQVTMHKVAKSPSLAERKKDESRSRGALVNLLEYLKEIHNGFFSCELEHELDSKDIRSFIKGPIAMLS